MDPLQAVSSEETVDDRREAFGLLAILDTKFLHILETMTQIHGPVDCGSKQLQSDSLVYSKVKALLSSLREHMELLRSDNNSETIVSAIIVKYQILDNEVQQPRGSVSFNLNLATVYVDSTVGSRKKKWARNDRIYDGFIDFKVDLLCY
ncbi:hypothetical protein QYM36_004907 [Artemia franciscana]|uniref:Uncharacterized protein n=1 Tax=Artemia franciscana TaxID=6661 RepID=A0AA88I0D2_ARTSF|nr:hypothetical protein QYM36_004907 [Artemia franciscana]